MITEYVHKGIRYTFSNENIQVGDKVFPIAHGRCLDGGGWILHGFRYLSGFPDEPHTILDLHHSDYKPYQVHTDHGYGPVEIYYKIIKKEKQVQERPESMFKTYKWTEIYD